VSPQITGPRHILSSNMQRWSRDYLLLEAAKIYLSRHRSSGLKDLVDPCEWNVRVKGKGKESIRFTAQWVAGFCNRGLTVVRVDSPVAIDKSRHNSCMSSSDSHRGRFCTDPSWEKRFIRPRGQISSTKVGTRDPRIPKV